ncbi:hypothetical protein DL93DRAFT_2070524 [Clavulina sp. PMI_390]|nr:hypothetical protein DL93DRAFT_2070524 [Clavulina sp. PMI_390]
MSYCTDIPVLTLFKGSSTSISVEVDTNTVTETSTLPDATTTLTLTSTSCATSTIIGTGGLTTTKCTPVVYTTASVIPGGTTTFLDTNFVTITHSALVTFPTDTQFSQFCTQTSTSTPTTPTSTTTSSPVSPGPFTNTTSGVETNSATNYTLSTPPASLITTTTAITSDGSIIPSTVTYSSQPPPTTIYNHAGGSHSSSNAQENSIIGGAVGAVIGALILFGILLVCWRKRKHRRDIQDALEYEDRVRSDFGRRLEMEFDDDDERNKPEFMLYSDNPNMSRTGDRPQSMAENTPMLVSGASSASQHHHHQHSSSSSLQASQNARYSIHSLYGQQPLAANEMGMVPPLPGSTTAASRDSMYASGGAGHAARKRSSLGSVSSPQKQARRPSTGRSSSDMLINFGNSSSATDTPPLPTPSSSTSVSSITAPPPSRPHINTRPNTADSQTPLLVRPTSSSSSAAPAPPPPSSFVHPQHSAPADMPPAPSRKSWHQHNRSSSRSSIMSALMSVAPLQTLKIANRTKMDDLEDDDEEGDTGAHEMGQRRAS